MACGQSPGRMSASLLRTPDQRPSDLERAANLSADAQQTSKTVFQRKLCSGKRSEIAEELNTGRVLGKTAGVLQ